MFHCFVENNHNNDRYNHLLAPRQFLIEILRFLQGVNNWYQPVTRFFIEVTTRLQNLRIIPVIYGHIKFKLPLVFS